MIVEIHLDGRPLTANGLRKLEYRAASRQIKRWRHAAAAAWAEACPVRTWPGPVIAHLEAHYSNRRAWPDVGAQSPTAKAIIDGLLPPVCNEAGEVEIPGADLISDDGPDEIAGLVFHPAILDQSRDDGVTVWLTAPEDAAPSLFDGFDHAPEVEHPEAPATLADEWAEIRALALDAATRATEWLVNYRVSNGVSAVAALTGISRGSLHRWIDQDHQPPNIALLKALWPEEHKRLIESGEISASLAAAGWGVRNGGPFLIDRYDDQHTGHAIVSNGKWWWTCTCGSSALGKSQTEVHARAEWREHATHEYKGEEEPF